MLFPQPQTYPTAYWSKSHISSYMMIVKRIYRLSKNLNINHVQILIIKGRLWTVLTPHSKDKIWGQRTIPEELQKKVIQLKNSGSFTVLVYEGINPKNKFSQVIRLFWKPDFYYTSIVAFWNQDNFKKPQGIHCKLIKASGQWTCQNIK